MANKKLSDFTDEELAQVAGLPGTIEDYQRTMEFRRRNLELHRKVAKAQMSAARWIMWSVVIACASIVVAALTGS